MIQDDFNFTLDSSDFPVSIEEFAAYLDRNLTDDEMQRVSTVIEHDDTMQDVMDSMELSELTLEEYGQENIQLPDEIADNEFMIPEIDDYCVGSGGFFHPYAEVAACAAAPIAFDFLNESFDDIEGNDTEAFSELDDNVSKHTSKS